MHHTTTHSGVCQIQADIDFGCKITTGDMLSLWSEFNCTDDVHSTVNRLTQSQVDRMSSVKTKISETVNMVAFQITTQGQGKCLDGRKSKRTKTLKDGKYLWKTPRWRPFSVDVALEVSGWRSVTVVLVSVRMEVFHSQCQDRDPLQCQDGVLYSHCQDEGLPQSVSG